MNIFSLLPQEMIMEICLFLPLIDLLNFQQSLNQCDLTELFSRIIELKTEANRQKLAKLIEDNEFSHFDYFVETTDIALNELNIYLELLKRDGFDFNRYMIIQTNISYISHFCRYMLQTDYLFLKSLISIETAVDIVAIYFDIPVSNFLNGYNFTIDIDNCDLNQKIFDSFNIHLQYMIVYKIFRIHQLSLGRYNINFNRNLEALKMRFGIKFAKLFIYVQKYDLNEFLDHLDEFNHEIENL